MRLRGQLVGRVGIDPIAATIEVAMNPGRISQKVVNVKVGGPVLGALVAKLTKFAPARAKAPVVGICNGFCKPGMLESV